jgi:rhomboid protease GluP
MLFTAMFLHANLLHLFGNVMFLVVFGVALEEQVSRARWLITYFASGVTGNLAFLFLGPFLGQELGLGASGAIYGLLGAAGGIRGAVVVILLAGLNIFSGGGTLAHLGGLLTGVVLRQWGDDLSQFFHLATSGVPK